MWGEKAPNQLKEEVMNKREKIESDIESIVSSAIHFIRTTNKDVTNMELAYYLRNSVELAILKDRLISQ